ncbi:MAG: hypothetical protein R3D98_05110 [Candidatus Krumholzibacteriia bacterium]
MVGPDEDLPIGMVSSYTVLDDPDYGVLTWDFPPVAHVTINNLGTVATQASSWGQVKGLFR